MSSSLQENHVSDHGTNTTQNVGSRFGQSFTPTVTHVLDEVQVYLGVSGDHPTWRLRCQVFDADVDGYPTGSGITDYIDIDYNDLVTGWNSFAFTTTPTITAETQYTIALFIIGTSSSITYYHNTIPGYTDGDLIHSPDGGSSWSTDAGDLDFREYGERTFNPPLDRITYKRLIAIASYYNTKGSLYYGGIGANADSMTELTDATGNIDAADFLSAFEGYQKVFIVNGSNLYVADFVNTKLTHSALTTAHAHGDVLEQGSSAISMVVDYTNAAKTATYGYVTAGTFVETTEVTGSGDGTAFGPTAVTNNPHWYSWTVYPGGESGSMPAKAYLGCLYRGRCVLSGNPNYPHQWYMSRQADPWDWDYTKNDAQAPVAGGNSDAGEIGDIVRAMIPYKDDYLLFGCANSLWVLRGDPCAGGSLDEISLTTGMFGATSWCWDDKDNLYFLGSDGIYIIPPGFGPPQNISRGILPKLLEDWDLDPSLHRVTMAFDPHRNGILICRTVLADGTNLNYWYDLTTQGFFPESYPATCGVYSALFYTANDDAYRGLILGTKEGYIRKFSDSKKNDDTTAIDSYATLPIQELDPDGDKEVKLNSLTVTLAGGAEGGAFGDTDEVTCSIYPGADAETVLEDIKDGATAQVTKTWATVATVNPTGRQNRIREKVRGRYIGIKFSNDDADETWAIEKVVGELKPAGRKK